MSFSISSNSLSNDVVMLESGQKAPFSGVLMSKETAELTRKKIIDGEAAMQKIPSFEKSIERYQANELLYQNQVSTVLQHNDKLAVTLKNSQSVSGWTKAGYFAAGVILSGFGVWGASKLAK